jgi:light-harvesting complex I chlorophyll a/b binding protein 1
VVQLLTDRRLQQTQLRTMRDMQDVLHELNRAMRQPERREQLLAQAQLLQSQVAEVVQDPLWSAALDAPKRRLFGPAALDAPKRRLFAPAMARSLRPHIKTLTRAVPRMAVGRRASGIAIQEGDIGVTPPLGIYDPLNLIQGDATKYRRFQELEIKHGRLAMAATLHVLITEAGFRFPGYLSDGTFGGDPIKFADMPAGTLASWAAMPALGWAQIIAFIALCDSKEIQDGLAGAGNEWLPDKLFAQDAERSPGDVASLDPNWWKRYDDPEVREFKLNAERNNGRAAMMGIVGMIIHEALTGNPLFPIPV